MVGKIDSHGFCCYLIVTDSLKSSAVSGVNQQQNQCDTDARHRKGKEGALEYGIFSQQVGSVCNGSQFVPLEDCSNNFCKAQGGNGKVVAFQLEHRQSNEEGKEGGGTTS